MHKPTPRPPSGAPQHSRGRSASSGTYLSAASSYFSLSSESEETETATTDLGQFGKPPAQGRPSIAASNRDSDELFNSSLPHWDPAALDIEDISTSDSSGDDRSLSVVASLGSSPAKKRASIAANAVSGSQRSSAEGLPPWDPSALATMAPPPEASAAPSDVAKWCANALLRRPSTRQGRSSLSSARNSPSFSHNVPQYPVWPWAQMPYPSPPGWVYPAPQQHAPPHSHPRAYPLAAAGHPLQHIRAAAKARKTSQAFQTQVPSQPRSAKSHTPAPPPKKKEPPRLQKKPVRKRKSRKLTAQPEGVPVATESVPVATEVDHFDVFGRKLHWVEGQGWVHGEAKSEDPSGVEFVFEHGKGWCWAPSGIARAIRARSQAIARQALEGQAEEQPGAAGAPLGEAFVAPAGPTARHRRPTAQRESSANSSLVADETGAVWEPCASEADSEEDLNSEGADEEPNVEEEGSDGEEEDANACGDRNSPRAIELGQLLLCHP
eukprot:TRINITY_DN21331_c0_g1_i1.p1 TRINITY_DN21331_c0_g1~~TRINITY_DN21331_c0_g1_i1.p1  ORF type:complete len:507 (-),score=39.53 TRINITY_DN21331_c0_g1_i1:24-1505(-)